MEPKILELNELIIVGTVANGNGVEDIDIHGLWQQFENHESKIKHKKDGKGYEVHIDGGYSEVKNHYCLTGVEVNKIEDIPLNMFVKVIPACKYAVFTHQFKNGNFGKAYEIIKTWLSKSEYVESLPFEMQCYDERFKGPSNPDSEMEFYIPIKEK